MEDSHEEDSWFSAMEYLEAIKSVAPKITPLHRQMLVAHADAPDHMLSVRQLATAGGYDHPNITFSQYGRLARLIAQALGVDSMEVWTAILGRGFRTESSEVMWEMHPELVEALVELGWCSRSKALTSLVDIANADAKQTFLTTTEREALVQARIGQGPFRVALLQYWGTCAVSGVSEPAVLRASHIKPWRDASNPERLDPANGLLLAAHLDALFDAGLITFDGAGQIRISLLLAAEDMLQLGVTSTMRLRHLVVEREAFMAYHRDFVFRKGIARET